MELDELKANWKSMDERVMTLEAAFTSRTRLESGRVRSRKMRVEPIVQLLMSIPVVFCCGNFLADHWSKVVAQPIGALPVVSLHLFGVFQIWLSIIQLVMVSQLDYAGPILETQARVARLKSLRVRATQFVFLVGLCLWVMLPIALGQAAFGYEFYRVMGSQWAIGNLLFGVVASAGLIALARRAGDRSKFFRFVNDIFAGTEILKAQKELAELQAFGLG